VLVALYAGAHGNGAINVAMTVAVRFPPEPVTTIR
jgi:hypothetical protein